MFTERMQILLTAAQRRRLEAEARRRRTSVGALIREAIDARQGRASLGERLRVVAEIKAMGRHGGASLTVEEIERLVDEEREGWLPRPKRGRAGGRR